jgi:hypothetical protein
MKYIAIIISMLLIALAIFLTADTPAMLLQSEQSGYKNIYTWLGTENPIALSVQPARQTANRANRPVYFFSDSEEYYGMVQHNGKILDISWYDADQKLQAKFSENWDFDIPLPKYHINSRQNSIIRVDITNRIRFYDTTGKIQNEIHLFKNKKYNSENNTFFRHIPQKDYLLIGFKHAFAGDNETGAYTSYVTMIDMAGNELYTQEFAGWQLNGLTISNDGAHVLLPMHTYLVENDQFVFRTVLLDANGNIVAEFPLQHNHAFFNSATNKAVFYKNETAWLLDVANNQIIKRIDVPNQKVIFMNGLFLEEKESLVLQTAEVTGTKQGWAYTNIAVTVLDHKGNPVQELALDNITQFRPVLRYDKNNQQLFIGHSSGYQYYSIN